VKPIGSVNACIHALAIAGTLSLVACGSKPLPDNAFKAAISVPYPPAALRAGQQTLVTVIVKNTSASIWRANDANLVQLGNHWRNEKDQIVAFDDGRVPIPRNLRPGEEVAFAMVITAPKSPGKYVLELDMVQERVAWFHDKGSQIARVVTTVE
jgi:hypothetical protein